MQNRKNSSHVSPLLNSAVPSSFPSMLFFRFLCLDSAKTLPALPPKAALREISHS